jgi:hypothetical protein
MNDKDSKMETTQDVISSEISGVNGEINKIGEQTDTQVVGWDGENDELNPMNWSDGRKWGILALVSLMTFITWVHVHSFLDVYMRTMF